MSDFRFAEPHWIHLIWLVILFTGMLIWLGQRGVASLDRLISPLMQKRLIIRPSRLRRLCVIGLIGLSAFSLVLALMRPQWGFHFERLPRMGAQLMIAVDVSRSMLAEDVAPNRLERAKAEIRDLLAYLGRDHVGLIAFAGRAAVLCPLTPDFGFLRLVLESLGPHSVTRGGTNLEAPIRKALNGFKGESDLSRVILMITDGEDHESFALEAAKAAAERGIHIITIGLGAESGSRVYVTDPKSGARTLLLDKDGKPVVTRLGNELLRKIALETGGVYIPAATGALDLKSIYESHIAPLTRGRLEDRGRLVRQEGFQWAVLLALLFLIAAVVTSSGSMEMGAVLSEPLGATRMVLLFLVVGFAVSPARGQEPPDAVLQPAVTEASKDNEERLKEMGPRKLYNQAVGLIDAEQWDDAERRLSMAREKAGSDSAARYRATYNLGWVEVKRADGFIGKQPEQALAYLKAAADWFREAVRLEPDEAGPRENLEIVTLRILVLADALAKHDDDDLAQQLDELIRSQREMTRLLQGTVERVAALGQPTLPESLKSEFRSLKVEQGKILSRSEELALTLSEETEQLEALKDKERDADQNMRLAQLRNVLAYLYRGGQRIGQARRQLRERQAERAYRRASAGLGELKRARDQLRSLIQLLQRVIGDAMLLTRQTGELSQVSERAPGASPSAKAVPKWLTVEYLQVVLTNVLGRTEEIAARMAAGLEAGDQRASQEAGGKTTPHQVEKRQRKFLLLALNEALPLMREARDAFQGAGEALAAKLSSKAYESEGRATMLLLKARELFLDIRGLIELVYGDEKYLKNLLVQGDKDGTSTIKENLPLLGQLQSTNLERGKRLGVIFDRELEEVQSDETKSPATPDKGESGNEQDTRRQQFQLAKMLLSQVMKSFTGIDGTIKRLNKNSPDKAEIQRLQGSVEQGIKRVEALRRLFFSILDHLKETALRQAILADETRDVATLTDARKLAGGVAPLVPRQQGLSTASRAIADSLKIQSEQSPDPMGGLSENYYAGGKTSLKQDSLDIARRLAQASEHVESARKAMNEAIRTMEDERKDLKATQESQATAVQKLVEAIQLLKPPPEGRQQKQEDESQQSQQQVQAAARQQQEQQARQTDMRHLLQSVRDREAQRRRDKRQRGTSGYAPVGKDW